MRFSLRLEANLMIGILRIYQEQVFQLCSKFISTCHDNVEINDIVMFKVGGGGGVVGVRFNNDLTIMLNCS